MVKILNSRIGSVIYIFCSLFLSIIFLFAGLGSVEVIDDSFISFLMCETMAFKFLWDGLIEYNHHKESFLNKESELDA